MSFVDGIPERLRNSSSEASTRAQTDKDISCFVFCELEQGGELTGSILLTSTYSGWVQLEVWRDKRENQPLGGKKTDTSSLYCWRS